MKPVRALLLQAGGLLFCGLAWAGPQHALTLYNEPPKYPAGFKHFDYVNPDAPKGCLLYTSPSPRDATLSRMPSSA